MRSVCCTCFPSVSMCFSQGFYHFGVVNSVHNMFADLLFCQKRGLDRHVERKSSVYGSDTAAQIDVNLGGRVYDPANSFYVLGRMPVSRSTIPREASIWCS